MREANRRAMFARMGGSNRFSEFFVRPTNTDLINNHKLGIGYQGPEMSMKPKEKDVSVGNFKWMNAEDTKSSKGASDAMRNTGKLVQNIIVKGKTKGAFKDY